MQEISPLLRLREAASAKQGRGFRGYKKGDSEQCFKKVSD